MARSRHEYNRRARNFATRYLRRHYGDNWDEVFTAVLPAEVEINTFPIQKKVWEKRLSRNWKDYQPWFWRTGSAVKQAVRRIAGQRAR